MRGTRFVSVALVFVVAVGVALSAAPHPLTARGTVWGHSDGFECDVQITFNVRLVAGGWSGIGSISMRLFDHPNIDQRVLVFNSVRIMHVWTDGDWLCFEAQLRVARYPDQIMQFLFRVRDDEAGDQLEMKDSCDTCHWHEVQVLRGDIVVKSGS